MDKAVVLLQNPDVFAVVVTIKKGGRKHGKSIRVLVCLNEEFISDFSFN